MRIIVAREEELREFFDSRDSIYRDRYRYAWKYLVGVMITICGLGTLLGWIGASNLAINAMFLFCYLGVFLPIVIHFERKSKARLKKQILVCGSCQYEHSGEEISQVEESKVCGSCQCSFVVSEPVAE